MLKDRKSRSQITTEVRMSSHILITIRRWSGSRRVNRSGFAQLVVQSTVNREDCEELVYTSDFVESTSNQSSEACKFHHDYLNINTGEQKQRIQLFDLPNTNKRCEGCEETSV